MELFNLFPFLRKRIWSAEIAKDNNTTKLMDLILLLWARGLLFKIKTYQIQERVKMIKFKELRYLCEKIGKGETQAAVAKAAVDSLERVLKGCFACLYELSDDQSKLTLLAYGSYPPAVYSIDRSNVSYWRAFARRERLVLDCTLLPQEMLFVSNSKQKAIIPLLWEERQIGALIVDALEELSKEQLELLEFVAFVVAKSMNVVKLTDTLEQSLKSLSNLNKRQKLLVDVSLKLFEQPTKEAMGRFLVSKVKEVFGFDEVQVLWMEGESGEGYRIFASDVQPQLGDLPFIIKAGKPLQMTVLIKDEESLRGLLTATSSEGKAFTKSDGELLSSLCGYVAAVLAARSQLRSIQRLRYMERTLVEILIEAAKENSIEDVCRYIARKLSETMYCDVLVYKIAAENGTKKLRKLASVDLDKTLLGEGHDEGLFPLQNHRYTEEIPIAFGGQVFGLLKIIDKHGYFSTKDTKDMLSILARHLGVLWAYQKAIHETKQEALKDSLTGLWNRRYFAEKIKEEMARCERSGEPFSVAIIDIRGFKAINDTFGHLEGDRILVEVAGFLAGAMRKIDVIARYGGDEFVSLHPRTREKEAKALWGRVEQKLKERLWGSRNLQIAIDVGIASYPDDGKEKEHILGRADERMYEVKRKAKTNSLEV
ncbi:MAG: hypothetical protein PWR00_1346 [Thermovirga sp.]|nr:hypothetical protein [Thermovirga sp.]